MGESACTLEGSSDATAECVPLCECVRVCMCVSARPGVKLLLGSYLPLEV